MEKIESKVKWEDSYDQSLQRSRQDGRPILMDFFKDG